MLPETTGETGRRRVTQAELPRGQPKSFIRVMGRVGESRGREVDGGLQGRELN